MNPAAINTPTFFHFASLPVELRIQIWYEALPSKDEPALFLYRKECWQPRLLSDSDNEEGWDHEDWNLTVGFQHELLDPIQVDIPLAFVNREARGVALPWIHSQRIELRFCQKRQHPVFARPFDPERDILYIGDSDGFCVDPNARLFERDLVHRTCSTDVKCSRIALPEKMLQTEADALPDLLLWFRVKVLLILVDLSADLYLGHNVKVQRWWRVKESGGDGLAWDREHGRFDLRLGKNSGQDNVSRHMGLINQTLGPPIQENSRNTNLGFDIWPVYASGS